MCLKNQQPPLNIGEQIANLKSKGLVIPDESYTILSDCETKMKVGTDEAPVSLFQFDYS